MKNKIVFMFCLMSICFQINGLAETKREANGYVYHTPGISQARPQQPNPQEFLQELRPPPQQQQSYTIDSSYSPNGQFSLPTNNVQNTANFALQQQQPFNHPALNFVVPTEPQLSNINYSPPQQFNSQQNNENVVRLQFHVLNENQGNSIEQGLNPLEPIVGQFKPELVDLANGGPLTRMITTCGPNNDCKTIALQSDLNRVLAVLPKQTHNQNGPYHQQVDGFRGYNYHGVEGRGNTGSSVNAGLLNTLVRPLNRRLIEYTEILQNDNYN